VDPLHEDADRDLGGGAAAEGSDEAGLGGTRGGGGGAAAGLRLHERREEGEGSWDPSVVLAQNGAGDTGCQNSKSRLEESYNHNFFGGDVEGFGEFAGRKFRFGISDLVREQTWDRERMPYEGVRSIWSVRIRIRVSTRWFYADSFLFLWDFYIFLSLLSKLNDKITNFQKYTTSTVKSNSSENLQIEASKYYLQVQLQKIDAQF
jgi:hypothetical protein